MTTEADRCKRPPVTPNAKAVYRRGKAAFKEGKSVDDCPYTDPSQMCRTSKKWWLQGYDKARSLTSV